MRWPLFLLLVLAATVVLADRVAYYRRAILDDPRCLVFGARSVCVIADDAAVASDAIVAPQQSFSGALDTDFAEDERAAVGTDAETSSWALSRIVQRALPLVWDYTPDRSGAAATVWILSSGVDDSSDEFSGRATTPFATSLPQEDCNGVGTRLAAIVGGDTWGVANLVAIRGVKVLNCQAHGSTSDIVAGLAYVADTMSTRNVVLMPFAWFGRSDAVNAAVDDLLAAGATVVAGVGEAYQPNCVYFPSAQAGVIAVSATRDNDRRYSYANYGACVDLFAPGYKVPTVTLGDVEVNVTSTQYAAAYVAGAAAQVLQSLSSLNSSGVLANLVARATLNQLRSVAGAPNRLLYVLQETNPPQPSAVPSAAAILTVGAFVIALATL